MPVDAPLLILNPMAGAGRARGAVAALVEHARRTGSGLAVVEGRSAEHARELAARAAERGHDRVVAVGGDGTVQQVASGLMAGRGERLGDRPSLGILPCGRGNDLARSLGLPRDRAAAAAIALGEQVAPLDLLRVGGRGDVRHAVSAGGVGFDAQVAAAMSRRRGRLASGELAYLLTTLGELRRFHNRSVGLSLDGAAAQQLTILLVAITNGRYYGGGMLICPDARTDDGLLDVCVVGDIGRLAAIGQLPNLYRGRHVSHPAVTIHRARRLRIDGDDEALVHFDGEPCGGLPIEVGVAPAALAVAVGP